MAYKLGAVKPSVVAAVNYFGPKYGIKTVYGWRAVGSVPDSDHPKGLAADFMTRDKNVGDALAADLVANASAWNIKYVIWWRKIWTPEKGWHNYTGPIPHTDHVHASFNGSASGNQVENVGLTDGLGVPSAVSDALSFLSDPARWRKVGLFILGSMIMLIGFVALATGKNPAQYAAKVGKAVSK